jgi:2'-5' RNA ligase
MGGCRALPRNSPPSGALRTNLAHIARRLLGRAYRLIAATPLRGLLRSRLAQRFKKSIVGMPAELVADVTDALERGGVRAWVMGGWATDAVLGEQTRDHIDLDIVFEAESGEERRALDAVEALGFKFVRREPIPGWLPTRIVLSDDRWHLVDLHPATFSGDRVVAQTADGNVVRLDRAEAFTTGTVAGRPVPCLSAQLQIAVHRGYEIREVDREDVVRLSEAAGLPLPPEYERRQLGRRVLRWARRRRPASALIVPVPDAEPIVGTWRAQHDPSAAGGMPAHVTLLYPFIPPDAIDTATEQALKELAAVFPSFGFQLERIGRFPGVLYLVPTPAQPFIELTQLIVARWPAYPPYGGEFDQVVPHLTVSQGSDPSGLADALSQKLPITAEAKAIQLMTQNSDGRWSVRASFPLAT